jgi:hypothetical protein
MLPFTDADEAVRTKLPHIDVDETLDAAKALLRAPKTGTPAPLYLTFSRGRDDKEGPILGPFDWVQLTYDEIRVSPNGDPVALFDEGDWHLYGDTNSGLDREPWSDVVIGPITPSDSQTPHTHDYDFSRYCGIRVCNDCGDHAGLERCYCGWSRSSGSGRTELIEDGETIEEEE